MKYLRIFYVTGVDYESTKSTKISYISDRVDCRTKLNIKEIFLRNNDFAANVYVMIGRQSENRSPIT